MVGLYECDYSIFKNKNKLYVEFKISDCYSIFGQITYIDLLKILDAINQPIFPIGEASIFGKHIRIIFKRYLSDETIVKLTFISKCQRDEALAYLNSAKLIRKIYHTFLAHLEEKSSLSIGGVC